VLFRSLLGLNTKRIPRFVKQYANLEDTLLDSVGKWRDDVTAGSFPADEHSFTDD
jgi:3-methyl-2-oxobutanoate hydroxymethyltransferase